MKSSSAPKSKTTSSNSTNWILRAPNQQLLENPDLRLLCIPHAGSGAYVYHSWIGHLPDSVEVLPIEIPGRNSRRKESPPPSLDQFAKDFVDALGLEYLSESSTVPYALFGHSLGAWMAYAIVQELQQRNQNIKSSGSGENIIAYKFPLALIVSGTRSPKLAGVAYDPDGVEMHKLDGPKFWEIFEKRYGQNPDLADPHVREFFRPKLQLDFKLGETYHPLENITAPLPCLLYVSVGAEDPRCVNKEYVQAWKECCSENTTSCQVKYFPGGHHYLLNEEESKNEFLNYLSDTLLNTLSIVVVHGDGVLDGGGIDNDVDGQQNQQEENTLGSVGNGGGGGNGGCGGSIKSMSSDAGATVASDSTYATVGGGGTSKNQRTISGTIINNSDDGGGSTNGCCCCF